jgi:hypothetical protein
MDYITHFNERMTASYLKMTGNKIKCPYCNQMVDINDMGTREEVVDSKTDFPWYLPNSIKVTTYKGDIPICSSCLTVFNEASEKSMHISLIVFAVLLALESVLCYFGDDYAAWFGFILLDVPLFFIVRFLIRYTLIRKKGIKYHVRNYYF